MPFIRRGESITYWEPKSSDVFGGDTFYPPRQLKARWEDVAEMIRDKNGQEIICRSIVYLDEEVNINGYLYKGVTVEADPRQLDGAFEIRQFSDIPDLRALRRLKVAYL